MLEARNDFEPVSTMTAPLKPISTPDDLDALMGEIGRAARAAARKLALASTEQKNAALKAQAQALRIAKAEILAANRDDLADARKAGVTGSFLDRLELNENRIIAMADGLDVIRSIADPVGVVLKSPGREPSAQEIAALVSEIRQHQIASVYAEPQFNARILDLAARDAGIQVRRLYSDAFDSEVKSYLDLMRFNVTSVVEGLR